MPRRQSFGRGPVGSGLGLNQALCGRDTVREDRQEALGHGLFYTYFNSRGVPLGHLEHQLVMDQASALIAFPFAPTIHHMG